MTAHPNAHILAQLAEFAKTDPEPWKQLEVQFAFDTLMDALLSSGKPVKCFGLTSSGDPKHPLFLDYTTPLVAM